MKKRNVGSAAVQEMSPRSSWRGSKPGLETSYIMSFHEFCCQRSIKKLTGPMRRRGGGGLEAPTPLLDLLMTRSKLTR